MYTSLWWYPPWPSVGLPWGPASELPGSGWSHGVLLGKRPPYSGGILPNQLAMQLSKDVKASKCYFDNFKMEVQRKTHVWPRCLLHCAGENFLTLNPRQLGNIFAAVVGIRETETWIGQVTWKPKQCVLLLQTFQIIKANSGMQELVQFYTILSITRYYPFSPSFHTSKYKENIDQEWPRNVLVNQSRELPSQLC